MNTIKVAFNASQWKPTLSEWILAGQLIQQEERKRISQFYFITDAKLSLAARLLLRYAIQQLTSMSWTNIELTRDDRNKPILAGEGGVHFNASHDGDFAVAAADTTYNIGADVMNNRRKQGEPKRFFQLMEKTFSKYEWECIVARGSEADQMKSFYRHWCLKESYVKAIGTGIAYPLATLTFDAKQELGVGENVSSSTLRIGDVDAGDWVFEETLLDERHCVAVARNVGCQASNVVSFQTLTFDELVKDSTPLCGVDDLEEDFVAVLSKPEKKLNQFYNTT